jgi:hypothetical protein
MDLNDRMTASLNLNAIDSSSDYNNQPNNSNQPYPQQQQTKGKNFLNYFTNNQFIGTVLEKAKVRI